MPPAIVQSPLPSSWDINEVLKVFNELSRKQSPHSGKDISYHLTISFDEALYGVEKYIEVLRNEIWCPVMINIPPLADSGMQVCILGEGEPSWNGGRMGNLYVIVSVTEHPLFTRIGRHICIKLPVKANFAKEGGQLQIPSIERDKFLLLNLPPNTKNGATFQVFESESYTLNTIIDIYNPNNLIALLKIQPRLMAIKKALHHKDYEIYT